MSTPKLQTCVCGATVDAKGLHGLACRKSGPRHIRHSQLNDLIWRAGKKAQIRASKAPSDYRGLTIKDPRRSDSGRVNSWQTARLRCDSPRYVRGVTLQLTSTTESAAAEKAAVNKTTKSLGGDLTRHVLTRFRYIT